MKERSREGEKLGPLSFRGSASEKDASFSLSSSLVQRVVASSICNSADVTHRRKNALPREGKRNF